MDKATFIAYWKDAPKANETWFRDGDIEYCQIELPEEYDGQYQSVGYDEVFVTAKFSNGVMLEIAHCSHVAFASELEKEFYRVLEAQET